MIKKWITFFGLIFIFQLTTKRSGFYAVRYYTHR